MRKDFTYNVTVTEVRFKASQFGNVEDRIAVELLQYAS